MASPGLLDIPYFIRPVADNILKRGAAKLRETADPNSYWDRSARNGNYRAVMGKFYDVMTDDGKAEWKGDALGLKQAAKGGCDPADCSLSIALSGGGLRVVAFLGFLEVLREHKIPVRAYAGTSAGSLATTFDRLGVDYKTVWEVLDQRLLKSLLFALNWTGLGSGIMTGRRVMDFMSQVVRPGEGTYGKTPGLYTTSVLVNSWANPVVIGSDKKGRDVIGGDFATYRKVVFSREYDPTMKLSEGVFSSMCLPVFESLNFRRRQFSAITPDNQVIKVLSTDNGWTIDGGYANNYPVDVLLLTNKANADPGRHIIINVAAQKPGSTEMRKQDLVQKLVYMASDVSSEDELERERVRYSQENVIWWEIGGKAKDVGLFDFNKLEDMKQAGRESAEKLLKAVGILQ